MVPEDPQAVPMRQRMEISLMQMEPEMEEWRIMEGI